MAGPDTVVERFDAEAVNSKDRRELYAARQKIHPKRASGWFRSLKWWIMLVTLAVYYLTPWIRWDRGPHAPDQAVLLDLANRRFYFFFIEIWPHEFFYVAGLLVMAGIGLFLVTSVMGRAWCGYACPQTVWVDLFLVVERFFEGERNARIKLDAAPWTSSKVFKRVAKHAVWLVIAVATGGAWIFYFADAPTLALQFLTGDANAVAYTTVAVLAATTYVFGGLMREQVCTYMCPWPRIQVAMLDEHSLVVTYNDWRGEPRSRHQKRALAAGETVGDCVDCNACVAVCPMGIDIRDGQQLECITCALCIDACDSVMEKTGRNNGLISYTTLNNYDHNMALAQRADKCAALPEEASKIASVASSVTDPAAAVSGEVRHFNWREVFRARTLLYTGIYALIGLALVTALLLRDRLDVNVLQDRNPMFVKLSDGSIRNGYRLRILNMTPHPRSFSVEMKGLKGARFQIDGRDVDQGEAAWILVDPDELRNVRTFVTVARSSLKTAQTSFAFVVREIGGKEMETADARFEAPVR